MSSNRNKPYYRTLLDQSFALSCKGYFERWSNKPWTEAKAYDFKARTVGLLEVPMSAISVSDLLIIKRHPLYGGLSLSVISPFITVLLGKLRVQVERKVPGGFVMEPVHTDILPMVLLGRVIPYSMEMLYVDDRRALEKYILETSLEEVTPYKREGCAN